MTILTGLQDDLQMGNVGSPTEKLNSLFSSSSKSRGYFFMEIYK